jgi:hypothetical protein
MLRENRLQVPFVSIIAAKSKQMATQAGKGTPGSGRIKDIGDLSCRFDAYLLDKI